MKDGGEIAQTLGVEEGGIEPPKPLPPAYAFDGTGSKLLAYDNVDPLRGQDLH